MRRTSKYYPLNWLVEARWPGNSYFEVIAAFNGYAVAKDYADNNAKAAKENGIAFAYRVLGRSGNRYDVVHEAS